MSKTAIINTGRTYFVKQLSDQKPIVLDKFIFANVTAIDGNSDIDVNTAIPIDNIVYSAPVTQAGLIGESAVAYSIVLDSQIGDFDFNFIGLMNAETNTLCMVMHCDITHKIKNNGTSQGNTLTQTLWLEIDNASQSTGITINAETWQIDFSERMAGEDERIRLSNIDIYGRLAIHDGIDITKLDKNKYTISSGLAYVAGLRVHIETPITITALPGQTIYIDAWLQGSVTGAWTVQHSILSDNNREDYVNGIFNHYIEPIANIDSEGNLIILARSKTFVTTEDLATTKKIGIVKLSSDIDSDSEDEAATSKAIKQIKDSLNGYLPATKNDDEYKIDCQTEFKLHPNVNGLPVLTNATGRLIDIKVIKESCEYTPSKNIKFIIIHGLGGGGAGGGAYSNSSSDSSAGSLGAGGGAGGYFKTKVIVDFENINIIIGAGGMGVIGSAGGMGGDTTFGDNLVAKGGQGGGKSGPSAASYRTGLSKGGDAQNGNIINAKGHCGDIGVLIYGQTHYAGKGGGSYLYPGDGGLPASHSNATFGKGFDASGFGCGGGGATAIGTIANLSGGNGYQGIIIIEEYSA